MSRIVFLGTPNAAVPTLEAVAASHDVGAVITRPDRARGRSSRLLPSPVKSSASALGLAVSQPSSAEELLDVLESQGPFDLGVVVAYGVILRAAAIELPAAGFLNVHFSLLPRWRGAAPVARALMAGDQMTGVTIIRIDEGLDTGPVLTAQAVDIGPGDSRGELTDRLASLGARLILESIEPYLEHRLVPVKQASEGSTYAPKLAPSDRILSPEMTAGAVVNRVRALSPTPGATFEIDGATVKILDVAENSTEVKRGRWKEVAGVPVVGVGGGSVEIQVIQPPGKRPMSGASWLRGRDRTAGVVA